MKCEATTLTGGGDADSLYHSNRALLRSLIVFELLHHDLRGSIRRVAR